MVNDLAHKALMGLLAAGAGGVVGWSGAALTMVGRIDAIEASMQRLDNMLTTLLMQTSHRAPPELSAPPPPPPSRKP